MFEMKKLGFGVVIVLGLSLGINEAKGQDTWFVDDDPIGGTRDGTSWATAFEFLQDAISAAQPQDTILVAEGVYHPDDDDDIPVSTHAEDEESETFFLEFFVKVHGGYIGNNTLGIDPNTRDPATYETILSGDLLDNDDPGQGLEQPNRQEI